MSAPQTTDEDGLVCVDAEEANLTVSDEKIEEGLSYVSKSRIKTFKQCPRKFWLKYWTENRPPGNYYTERGSEVHECFEVFHENLKEHLDEGGEAPKFLADLMPDDFTLWSQWLEPYLGHFWKFEERRWLEAERSVEFADSMMPHGGLDVAAETLNAWEPVEVEAEAWLGEPPEDCDVADDAYINPDGPPVGEIPWMGSADAIFHSASVPEVDGGGVTILDYKTGSVPDPQYRDEGIFLEGEFYGWLFEKFFDVDAVAGYYPKEDELIISPYPDRERRWEIKKAVLGLQDDPTDMDNFPVEEQPLCHYGHGQCFFYPVCPSQWNE